MVRISGLIPKKATVGAIGNTQYMFGLVNGFLRKCEGKCPLFEIKLVGASKEIQLKNGLFTIKTYVNKAIKRRGRWTGKL